MNHRPYQREMINGTIAHFDGGGNSGLIVAATGTGKTVVFTRVAEIMHNRDGRRALIIAHRDELIRSAAKKLKKATGVTPEIEKAHERAVRTDGLLKTKSPYVVASIQTLLSGRGAHKRMHDFDPAEFDFVVIDEAHHAVAAGYLAAIRHFTRDGAKLLGVSATADRADGVSLAAVFEKVIARYELPPAQDDGYLVPVRIRSVVVGSLDYSKCRVTKAGHLRDEDVAAAIQSAMAEEDDWHPVAYPVLEVAHGFAPDTLKPYRDLPFPERSAKLLELADDNPCKRTLIFCPTVATSQRLRDIFNRWSRGIAAHVDGDTPPRERNDIFRNFEAGSCPILCNCAVAEEGVDIPATEVIVLVSKTKSRPKTSQRIGRGTRPHPSIADAISQPGLTNEDRRRMIAQSPKPSCTVLDFIGDCGKHRLVGPADLLAGDDIDPEVLQRVQELCDGVELDSDDAIAQAEVELAQEREIARQIAEQEENELVNQAEQQFYAALRQDVVATTNYIIRDADESEPAPQSAPRESIGTATENQVSLLIRYGVKPETARGMSKGQAGGVIDSYQTQREKRQMNRWPLSDKQIGVMVRAGYERADICRNLDGDQFSLLFDAVKGNGWKAIGSDIGTSLLVMDAKEAA